MKTYVLMLSQVFPADHPRAGESTIFATKLQNAIGIPILGQPFFAPGEPVKKIHTIRANYDLWKKRFDKIDKGEAKLSIRVWEGKPYRSKQIEIARLDRSHGIGIQQVTIDIKHYDTYSIVDWFIASPEELRIDCFQGNAIAFYDGLTFKDWLYWFKTYDLSKPMAIIHFTPFRYC